eukprot:TRINITY_DN116_c0_g1_i9.p1 TRINITY_DN116_c0_g1~~TRINITY_DN116_c0_g1_i9.p1  ORF type:complete len:177 (+),score=35.74 TRINITY_DN116_c0_g1_i9:194-724(+)
MNWNAASPFDPRALSNQDRIDYDKCFFQLDSNRDGFIEGNEAVNYFGPSGLRREDLARTWNLSDSTGRGRLSKLEFRIALHLVNSLLRGFKLPTVIPLSLLESAKTSPQQQNSGNFVSSNNPPPIPPRINKVDPKMTGKEQNVPIPVVLAPKNHHNHSNLSPPAHHPKKIVSIRFK